MSMGLRWASGPTYRRTEAPGFTPRDRATHPPSSAQVRILRKRLCTDSLRHPRPRGARPRVRRGDGDPLHRPGPTGYSGRRLGSGPAGVDMIHHPRQAGRSACQPRWRGRRLPRGSLASRRLTASRSNRSGENWPAQVRNSSCSSSDGSARAATSRS